MTGVLIYCGGNWMPHCNLSKDLGLWRATGVLEVLEATFMTTHKMFHWDDHYRRLILSCARYDANFLRDLPSEGDLKSKINLLLERADRLNSVVWIRVTGGDSDNLKSSKDKLKLILYTSAFPEIDFTPLKLMTKTAQRECPEIKSAAMYGLADKYVRDARNLGYDSFLYCSPWTGITEGPYENIFFVTKDNILVTPKIGILEGITRKIVLQLARESGIFNGVEEREQIYLGALENFDEVFLTSTTKWVHPVGCIDLRPFKCGLDTKTYLLRQLFLRHRENYYKECGTPI